jgi:hypothetical protein
MTIPSISTRPIDIPLGDVYVTANAQASIPLPGILNALSRHRRGDFGEIDANDRESNLEALDHGDRILSAYAHGPTRFWIITEADRSLTTVLLPEDY